MFLKDYQKEVKMDGCKCFYGTYQSLCKVMKESDDKKGFQVTVEEFMLYFADMIDGAMRHNEINNLLAMVARISLIFGDMNFNLLDKYMINYCRLNIPNYQHLKEGLKHYE